MSFGDCFGSFSSPLLFNQYYATRWIARLERQRNSRVILLVHRQEMLKEVVPDTGVQIDCYQRREALELSALPSWQISEHKRLSGGIRCWIIGPSSVLLSSQPLLPWP
jgi:hypothetical protein